MKPLKIRDTVLGEGIPKICVPLVAGSEKALFAKAEAARELLPDLVEWRADFLDTPNPETIREVCLKLHEILFPIPVIFTLRTTHEGGKYPYTASSYRELLSSAAETGCVDIIDVEALSDSGEKKELIRHLKTKAVYTIASSHDFEKTDREEVLLSRWEQLEDSGADILKMAVMPRTREDVVRLMDTTYRCSLRTEKLLIAMSMGELGRESRYLGGKFGSCLTFGAGEDASAPGQIPVSELRRLLRNTFDNPLNRAIIY